MRAAPTDARKPVELFLDIEGIPDEGFQYLFGVLVRRGDGETMHSLWADTLEDEPRVWGELRALLDADPDAQLRLLAVAERFCPDVVPEIRAAMEREQQ